MPKKNKTMTHASLVMDGTTLDIKKLSAFILEDLSKVALAQPARAKVQKAHDFLIQESRKRIIYGINTGFGPMAYKIMAKTQLEALQENLIRSHAAGIGRNIEPQFVLAAMLVRLNTLAKGYSGVSAALLDSLSELINMRIIPAVPEHGAVGTSGDLVQLSHIALALLGEGNVFFQGKPQTAKKVFVAQKIQPYRFKPKEGLAMINGTSFMAGMGTLLCREAENLLDLAQITAAAALEAVESFDDSISELIQVVRPHPGQVQTAARLRKLLGDSKRLRNRSTFEKSLELGEAVQSLPREIQEVYSLRCSPQIIGPILDTLKEVKKVLEREINSATDNPLVDIKNRCFPHGGNFHGDYVAAALDKLKSGMVKLTILSERRVNFFCHDKKNLLFPPFLNLKEPGLNLALQGLQFVATSTTAQSQSLAYPHHLHSIPTNGENQDVVSMGSDAALFLRKVIDNAYTVFTIEAAVLTQAMDITGNLSSYSSSSQALYHEVRGILPAITTDRYLSDELAKLKNHFQLFKINGSSWL